MIKLTCVLALTKFVCISRSYLYISCIFNVLGVKMQTRPYSLRSLSRKNPTTIHFHHSQLNVSQTNELFLFFRLKYCYTFNVYVITVLYGFINLYAILYEFHQNLWSLFILYISIEIKKNGYDVKCKIYLSPSPITHMGP